MLCRYKASLPITPEALSALRAVGWDGAAQCSGLNSLGGFLSWLLVSGPGFFSVLVDFGRISIFMWEFRSMSNIVYYWIQYLAICFILDLQENIYKQVEKTDYPSAGEVGFGDLSIDIFLEVQNQTYS